MAEFLYDTDARKGRWRDDSAKAAEERGVYAQVQWTGEGRDALNVAYATTHSKPNATIVRDIWKRRHGRAAAPLLVVVAYPEEAPQRAMVCGPKGEAPAVVDLDIAQAERIAGAALNEPSRHAAERFLMTTLQSDAEELPGLRNQGLLATHELAVGVPARADWSSAKQKAADLMSLRDQELIRGLGFTIEQRGQHRVLRDADDASARAVAVFLQPGEQPDAPSANYGAQTPVTYALTHADRDNLRWVVTVRGGMLRLYSTATTGAAGQRGRTETYVEVNLPLLRTDQAAYLHLLFSSKALADGGTVDQIREASTVYTTGLATRLRERVYDEVVPRLALAVADAQPDRELETHYRTALTILFRLLFLAYGEHQELLPYRKNAEYTASSLTSRAKSLARIANEGGDLGFDNPLTPEVEPTTDPGQTDLWDTCQTLFHAVNAGHSRWGVPAYNGGLFSTEADVNPVGPIIQRLSLSNAVFGPALFALLIDHTPDGDVGPIDFRSLSVREFGTIYEGLLESELARAETDLALVRHKDDLVYEPTDDPEAVEVAAGAVYLHDKSGARKSSGSYFTKPFAVDHLLQQAVVPTLQEHLERVGQLVDTGKEADAARALFDFRVADVAMGSGHFLTAVVDTIEVHVSQFLAERPIPQVIAELDRLKKAAENALPEDWDGSIEQGALLRRLIARRCVYGVDLNPVSVELARVAMWIHTFVPGLPLSFLDHNLIVGNSLTGIATLDEITDAFEAEFLSKKERAAGVLTTGLAFLSDALEAAEEPLNRLRKLNDATVEDVHAAAEAAAEARRALGPLERLADLVVASRVSDEVTLPDPGATGDVDLLDLPEGLSRAGRLVADEIGATHLPVVFPEVFSRKRPGFDVVVGNPPWEKVKVEEHEFWGRHFPGLRGLNQAEKNNEIERLRTARRDLVESLASEQEAAERLRQISKAGPYELGSGDTELARIFTWRFWDVVRDQGRIGVVVPRSVALASPGMAAWRGDVLNTGAFEDVCLLVNNRQWIFDNVHPQYSIALLTVRRATGENVEAVRLQGPYRSFSDFEEGKRRSPAEVPVAEFRTWSDTLAFPLLPDTASVEVYRQLMRHPRFGDDQYWEFRPVNEVHATNDKEKFVFGDDSPEGYWPVYSGASFNLWTPETGEIYAWTDPDVITEHLFEKRKSQANHSRSAFYGLPDEVLGDPTTLPCFSPRIAFRDVARATDSRTMIAALVPPQIVPQHSAPYLLRVGGSRRAEAFVLGVLSSVPFDWMARREVETHVTFTVLNALPLPAASDGHPGYDRAVEIAGTLAAVDDRYSDWADEVGVPVGGVNDTERFAELTAELDAVVSRLYGLDESQIVHVFETFHHGWDHSERLDAVLSHYHNIDWSPAEVAS